MNTELAQQPMATNGEIEERSVSTVLAQVSKIQQIMKAVMHVDEHYGVIPGCKKPSLYKPGAEKLGFVFRLVPRFIVERTEYDNGHREYMVTCELYNAAGQTFAGSGLGCCSTMEAKYRYRSGPKEFTGQPVPQDYWTQRKTDPAGALKSIGGPGHATAKNPDTGQWEVCIQGERVEYEDPADYYNTSLKIAKKRAHTDAILTTTAASDIFTQDVDDEAVQATLNQEAAHQGPGQKGPIQQPQRRSVKSESVAPEQAPEKADPRMQLLNVCVTLADAGVTVATTDHKDFSLVQGQDTPDEICVKLSSFVGRDGQVVPGKTVQGLSDKAVYMTLKKAKHAYDQLPEVTSQEEQQPQEEEEDLGQILDEAMKP